jgi:hypothetical protein
MQKLVIFALVNDFQLFFTQHGWNQLFLLSQVCWQQKWQAKYCTTHRFYVKYICREFVRTDYSRCYDERIQVSEHKAHSSCLKRARTVKTKRCYPKVPEMYQKKKSTHTQSPNRHRPLQSSSFGSVHNDLNVSATIGSCPGSPFVSASSTFCDSDWISSTVSNLRPFNLIFILGKRKKSQGAKSDGGWP